MHRSRGSRTLAGATLVAVLLALVWALQAASQGGGAGGAEATARGAIGTAGTAAAVTASTGGAGERSAAAAGIADPLGTVDALTTAVRARRDASGSAATAQVVAGGLVLLGGRVRIGRVTVRARAAADTGAVRAELVEVSVSDASLDGAPLALAPGARVEVPGAGTVLVGEMSSEGPGTIRVNGVRVTAGAGEEPGGLVVGHLELRAVAGPGAVDRPPARRPSPDPDLAEGPSAVPPKDDPPPPAVPPVVTSPPVRSPVTPPVVEPPAAVPTAPRTDPGPAPRLLPGTPGDPVPGTSRRSGAVFPVLGVYSFTADYGAPRAGTGWHQGNDVFAAVGTPVVAVADGTVSKVGWNTLGGNRLWLTDGRGTGYYYAHLSAYAPSAYDGASVRAGEVLGYVGNTGQAATTPPHLHFEIRPGGPDADSVDPYPFLRAWEAGAVTTFELSSDAEAAPDAAAGAVVVGIAPEVDAPPPAVSGAAISAR